MIIKESDKEYELIPEGTHVARCYMVCDLGRQKNTWQGVERIQRKLRISFECPTLFMEEGQNEGKPFSATRTYTASLFKNSHLYEHLTSWRGRAFTAKELKAFDTSRLIGIPALITIIHLGGEGDKIYPGLSAITGLPKDLKCPKAINKTIDFSLDDPDYLEKYKELPEWLQQKININNTTPGEAAYKDPDQIGGDPDFDDTIEDVPF